MSYISVIYDWIAPTVIVGATLTYWFAIRQKRFDLNQEHFKKIRYTTSDLLSIWNEYAKIEIILKSKTPNNIEAIYVKDFAVQFLNLDEKTLAKVNSSFFKSLENLKEIDVVLFHRLKESQNDFERFNKEFFLPLLKSQLDQKDFEIELTSSVLDELMEAIEITILETVKHLPRKERKKVKFVLDQHLDKIKNDIKEENALSEMPDFMVKLINKSLRPKIDFTKEEMISFYSDKTVKWIIDKTLKIPTMRKAVFSKNSGINLILALVRRDDEFIESIFSKVDQHEFKISQQEATIFIDNKDFYLLILSIVQKMEGQVSMKIKRELVKINKGEISLAT